LFIDGRVIVSDSFTSPGLSQNWYVQEFKIWRLYLITNLSDISFAWLNPNAYNPFGVYLKENILVFFLFDLD
jgi:hypothetical protein